MFLVAIREEGLFICSRRFYEETLVREVALAKCVSCEDAFLRGHARNGLYLPCESLGFPPRNLWHAKFEEESSLKITMTPSRNAK
ncbi:hypothetical protein A2U01_0078413, partial [Trifolium medium]|nr:hypothetical protein [Trifolium medium]